MVLAELMEIMEDGTACFTILPYCEEYRDGLENMRHEPWYPGIKKRLVKSIVTIGGGAYPVETCIGLDN